MDFRSVLVGALQICGAYADDPFLLYCALCDKAGNDFILAPQVEVFHRFNKTLHLVTEMKQNPEPKTIGTLLDKCKKQPDASERLCLNWIHTLFEFYNREKNGSDQQTERDFTENKPKQGKPPTKSILQIQVPRPLSRAGKSPVNPAPSIRRIKVTKKEHESQ